MAFTPRCTARVIAADMPRALKLAVGLNDSSLTKRFENFANGPRGVQRKRGVAPSPSETACSGASTGRTSQNLHVERSGLCGTTWAVDRPQSDSRSYPARRGFGHP